MRKLTAFTLSFLLIFSLFVILYSVPEVKGAGENWLLGWQYRKSHTIQQTIGAGTNYQLEFILHYGSGSDSGNEVYLNSHSETDFADVRFTEDDGNTELYYWLEEYTDSDNGIFWVKISDDLDAGAVTIYLYYGNATVSTTSDIENTWIFGDDAELNDLSRWTTVEGQWSTSSAQAKHGTYSIWGDGYSSGRTLEKELSASAVTGRIKFYTYIIGKTQATYHLTPTMSNSTPIYMVTSLVSYFKYLDGGGWQIIQEVTEYTWYKFEIIFNWTENAWKIYIDDSYIMEVTTIDAINIATIKVICSSTIGHDIYVDDYVLGKCVYDGEPTHGGWGSEEEYGTVYYLNYSQLSQNSTMLHTNVTFTSFWESNGTLESYVFEWNYTGSFVQDDAIEWSNTTSPQWANITKAIDCDTTKHGYVISWRINATAIGATFNATDYQNFTITGLLVTYTIYPSGSLYINSESVGNETLIQCPDLNYTAQAYPDIDYSFFRFNYNGTIYTANPANITYTASEYMIDNYQNFLCYFESEIEEVTESGVGDFALIIALFAFVLALVALTRR